MVWFSTVPAGFFLTLRLKNKTKREKYEDGNGKDAQRGTLLLRRAGVAREFRACCTLCARMRTMTVYDGNYRKTIEDLIPGIPSTSVVNPPFQCDHGTGIVLGENVFVNYNCVMLDAGYIRIGRNTKVGPCCQFYTPQHPIDYMERREPKETAYPITIGEDCWLGGGVVVCPGVTIGNRCVIAAGSVVVKDIPDDSLAAGCPAIVKKRLNGKAGVVEQ